MPVLPGPHGIVRHPQRRGPGHFDELALHFTEDQVVELVAVTSLVGGLDDTMATDLGDEPPGFGCEHLAAQGWDPGEHAHP